MNKRGIIKSFVGGASKAGEDWIMDCKSTFSDPLESGLASAKKWVSKKAAGSVIDKMELAVAAAGLPVAAPVGLAVGLVAGVWIVGAGAAHLTAVVAPKMIASGLTEVFSDSDGSPADAISDQPAAEQQNVGPDGAASAAASSDKKADGEEN